MLLKKLQLKNIRSYKESEVIFPEGSTVLAGDIGSGKTSVLLAIEFALFGLQPGQKGTSLLRNGEDEGFVRLEFEIDSRNVIVERGLKRGKSVTQSYALIEIDGEKKDLSVKQLKNNIITLLQYPKEFETKTNLLYKFTVYTPQEQMKQIILEAPETRLDLLRHIFGIDKYKRIRENVSTLTIKLRENIRDYEGQTKTLEDTKKKLEEKKNNLLILDEKIKILRNELKVKLEEEKNAHQDLQEVEEKIKEKERFEKEIEKTQIMLIGKKEFISSIEKEKTNLEKQIKDAEHLIFNPEEIEKLNKQKEENEKQLEEKNKEYLEVLSRNKSLTSKVSEANVLKGQISALQLCPTCLQNVDEGYKKNIIRKFNDDIIRYEKEISLLARNRDEFSSKTQQFKKIISEITKKLEEFNLLRVKLESIKEKKNKFLELVQQKERTEKDALLLEKQIETLKESVSLFKKYETIYEQKRKILQEKEREEREKEISLASSEKENQMSILFIQEIQKEIEDREKIKEKLLSISELEDWLSSSFLEIISLTEKNIMFKLREEFSKLFNKWFNILVPENFLVNLDEEFTPIIQQQDYQLDYSFLSGGERTAVALAYRLSLNQVINSLMSRIKTKDLVILDEPTEGFSEQQLDKMRDVLSELKVKQLIIVSHESKIESFVEKIIKFRKESGITKVEV